MNGNIVHRRKHGLQRGRLDIAHAHFIGRKIGVIGYHAHSKRDCAPRHFAADAPHRDQPERFAVQFHALQLLLRPLTLFHPGVGKRHAPRQAQHKGERQFSYGHTRSHGRIDHRDTVALTGLQVDVVHAHTGAPHHIQLRRGGNYLRHHFCAAAHHQTAIIPDNLQQLTGINICPNVNTHCLPKFLHAGCRYRICDQHAPANAHVHNLITHIISRTLGLYSTHPGAYSVASLVYNNCWKD